MDGKKTDYALLAACELFRGFAAPEIEALLRGVPFSLRRFEPGEIVYHFLTEAEHVGLILRGRVQAHKLYLNGGQVNLTVRAAGQLIGPVAAFSSARRYPFEVLALEPTEVLSCEKTAFLSLLHKDLRLLENFLRELTSAHFILQQRLELLTYRAIQEKVAFFLVMSALQGEQNAVRIPGSVSKWALTMNVSRTSLHRELKKMEARGLIRYAPPAIEILDKEGLKQLLEKA